jgi:hypothetical protein
MSPRRLVGLYPAAWRHRYGDEFLALLEDRPPAALQVVDIVWGAIDAYLFPQAPEGRFRMFTRIAGLAAVGAGLILSVGVLWTVRDELNAIRISILYALILVGLTGIFLRQVKTRPALAWFGFLAGMTAWGLGVVVMVLSAVGVLPPSGGYTGFLGGVILWVGSTAVGATMLAIGVFPLASSLAITIGAPLAMIGLFLGLTSIQSTQLVVASQTGIFVFGLGWILAGISLLTAQPRGGVLTSQT